MLNSVLEFEKPIAELESKINEMKKYEDNRLLVSKLNALLNSPELGVGTLKELRAEC